MVRLLLDNGANIHALNDQSLIFASLSGHLEVVRLLLDRGANIHTKNDRALYYAFKFNNKKVVKLLLSRGANKKVIENSFCIIS